MIALLHSTTRDRLIFSPLSQRPLDSFADEKHVHTHTHNQIIFHTQNIPHRAKKGKYCIVLSLSPALSKTTDGRTQ